MPPSSITVRSIMAEASEIASAAGGSGGAIRLDERTTLVPDLDGIKRYIRTPASAQAVKKKAQEVADNAMSMRTRGHAEYGVIVYNDAARSRPVAVVRAMNINAVFDDLVFGTLLKAVANVRSDPIP